MSFPTKLTVGSTFSTQPPLGGGRLRILHLYRQIARYCPVDVIALVGEEKQPVELELACGLTEVRIPKSAAHIEAEWALEREAGVPVTDIAFTSLHELTPQFAQAVARSVADGGAVVASHPYALPAMAAASDGLPVWYDVHNVESDLKAAMLASNKTSRKLLADTREVERACCERAGLVFAASAQDASRLQELYDVPPAKLAVVPNGIDTAAVRFDPPRARRRLREYLRMDRPLALFVGSWHDPNVRAARCIVKLSKQMHAVEFGVAGSVCTALGGVRLPDNVTLFGVVPEGLKAALLSVAAVAINPMAEGSGTNMKMLDYLAAGIPVISTAMGARGLDLDPQRHVRIVPLESFPSAINEALNEPVDDAETRAVAARRYIEERFDWTVVAHTLMLAAEGTAGVASAQRREGGHERICR